MPIAMLTKNIKPKLYFLAITSKIRFTINKEDESEEDY